jgi:hypothetical protein
MAGGPIGPISAYPSDTTGRLFPMFYAGGGGNAAATEEGMGVAASLSADSTWELRFHIPPSVPTGTLKLRVLGLTSASSGTAKFTVSDKNVAAGASPSAATLNAETQSSVTFTSVADKYQETKVTLTSTPSGNDILVVALTFNTTGWTLASASCWIATLIWE